MDADDSRVGKRAPQTLSPDHPGKDKIGSIASRAGDFRIAVQTQDGFSYLGRAPIDLFG
jgi:hypothetical protein